MQPWRRRIPTLLVYVSIIVARYGRESVFQERVSLQFEDNEGKLLMWYEYFESRKVGISLMLHGLKRMGCNYNLLSPLFSGLFAFWSFRLLVFPSFGLSNELDLASFVLTNNRTPGKYVRIYWAHFFTSFVQ